jgi:hypothetical protein
MRRLALIVTTAIAAAILSAAPISLKWSAEKNLSVSQDKALAVVGRPATPGSVAGVARRAIATGIPATPRLRWATSSPCRRGRQAFMANIMIRCPMLGMAVPTSPLK